MKINLMYGDCLDKMETIPPESVDMVLVDPPYGTTACKWDSVIPLKEMWESINRVVMKNSAIVIMAAQPFTSKLGESNLKWLRYSWVWEKHRPTGHLNVRRMPMKNHEDVLVFYKKQPTYNPQGMQACDRMIRRTGNGDCYGKSGKINHQTQTGYPKTILKFKRDKSKIHPTQKPVSLMEYFIRTYTDPGQTVLDFTMGSGTTGVACKKLGRNFIGIELDKKYFEIAKARIGEPIRRKKKKLNTF